MNNCACGCGAACGGTWLKGHNRRGVPPTNKIGFTKEAGYRLIYRPDHPEADRGGYVREHRMVAEQMLGRRLTRDEVVHHRNGVRDDNRPENLEVMAKTAHDRVTVLVSTSCSVAECERPHAARGLCAAHYNRYRRAGRAMPLAPSRGSRWARSAEREG